MKGNPMRKDQNMPFEGVDTVVAEPMLKRKSRRQRVSEAHKAMEKALQAPEPDVQITIDPYWGKENNTELLKLFKPALKRLAELRGRKAKIEILLD
jgi:hypothetical protein